MKQYSYIAVAGTMGSGKTTAARLIAQALKYHLLEENFGDNAFLSRFYTDMKKWAFHSQSFFLLEKITQMRQAEELLKKTKVIQDTPVLQDVFSYAKAQHLLGNMDDAERALYQKIYRSFESYLPKPDIIIFLDTSIPVLVDRVIARGRSYEQDIPREYIALLDELNRLWISKETQSRVVSINTDTLNIVKSKTAQREFIRQVKEAL